MKKYGFVLISSIAVVIVFVLVWSSTAQDYLRVVATYPANNAKNVSPDLNRISVTFSNNMDPASLNSQTFSVKEDQGDPITGDISYGNRTATIALSTSVGEITIYEVWIDGDVRDVNGVSLGPDYVWHFSTGMK